jgi:hypothetical protein
MARPTPQPADLSPRRFQQAAPSHALPALNPLRNIQQCQCGNFTAGTTEAPPY